MKCLDWNDQVFRIACNQSGTCFLSIGGTKLWYLGLSSMDWCKHMNEAKKKSQQASTWRGFRWALQHAAGRLKKPDWQRFWREAGFAIAPERCKEGTSWRKKGRRQKHITYEPVSSRLCAG